MSCIFLKYNIGKIDLFIYILKKVNAFNIRFKREINVWYILFKKTCDKTPQTLGH